MLGISLSDDELLSAVDFLFRSFVLDVLVDDDDFDDDGTSLDLRGFEKKLTICGGDFDEILL